MGFLQIWSHIQVLLFKSRISEHKGMGFTYVHIIVIQVGLLSCKCYDVLSLKVSVLQVISRSIFHQSPLCLQVVDTGAAGNEHCTQTTTRPLHWVMFGYHTWLLWNLFDAFKLQCLYCTCRVFIVYVPLVVEHRMSRVMTCSYQCKLCSRTGL